MPGPRRNCWVGSGQVTVVDQAVFPDQPGPEKTGSGAAGLNTRRIFFDLGHPAHVHYFRNAMQLLKQAGHQVGVSARDKDLAHELLRSYGIDFVSRGRGGRSSLGKLLYLPAGVRRVYRAARAFRADLLVSFASPYAAWAARLLGVPHLAFDDTEHAGLAQRLYRPFTALVLTPDCYRGPDFKKQRRFPSYMELSYLHPARFTPDPGVLAQLGLGPGEKFVILRFVSWQASHDAGLKGFSASWKLRVTNELAQKARVFISSETPLAPELEPFRFPLPPAAMHQALAFADLLFGESATMASEAAVLGTPAVYLDEVGRGYTSEQESRYGLVANFRPDAAGCAAALERGLAMLAAGRDSFKARRESLLAEKIDLTAFMFSLLENYPENPVRESISRKETERLEPGRAKETAVSLMRSKYKILIYLGHPAHYHLFKNSISSLQQRNHQIIVLIKKKDVLEELLADSGIPYQNILPEGRGDSRAGIAWGMVKRDLRLFRFCLQNRPDLLIGTSAEIGHVGSLFGIRSIIVNEDDAAAIPLFGKIAYPWCDVILSPDCCHNGKWEKKSLKHPSYHELAYLHPDHFTPNPELLSAYGFTEEPFFLLRFARLNAHHDRGVKGVSDELAGRIISRLSDRGRVLISSERELRPEFEPYRLKINPRDVHHIMAFASMFIGDSQTMAAEAGVLGVPFLRCNDFVGRLGYLAEIEGKYKLGYGIKPDQPELLLKRLEELLNMPERHQVFQNRRAGLLADKINFADFLTVFIEEYARGALPERSTA